MSSSALDQLRGLLVGATVLAVDPPDKDAAESIFKITVRKDGHKQVFHLCATDMGFWIGRHTRSRDDQHPLYESFGQLLEDVGDYASALDVKNWKDAGRPGEGDPYWENHSYPIIEALSDPKVPCIGFRCPTTGREWRASLRTVKAYELEMGLCYRTPESRKRAAEFMGEWGIAPTREALYHTATEA